MPGSVTDNERTYLIGALGLSAAVGAGMSISDLRLAFYSNPPAGGSGGLDLTNSTGTLNADKIVSGSTNKVYSAADQAKVASVATGATANSSDAALLNRANHTGTQSLDTTTDSATRAVVTPAAVTKLAGVATGATANDTDANLKNRANHTGTQTSSTISDFTNASKDVTGALLTNGTGITYNYNGTTRVMTTAVVGGRESVYNGTVYSPARDADNTLPWKYYSTNYISAPVPSDAVAIDTWVRHPDAAPLP